MRSGWLSCILFVLGFVSVANFPALAADTLLPITRSIRDELARDAKAAPDPQPTLAAVRRDLRHYLAANEYFQVEAPDQLFRDRRAELAASLSRLDQQFSPEDAHRAGELVAWFESLGGEGAELAAAVRAEYCRTNAAAKVSARLINLLMERSIEEQRFISDTVLGAYTRGTAFTRAQVSFAFVPSQEHATLDIRMLGQADCPANVAERGRVSVYSSANTSIRASKHILFDAEGLRFAPAVAACSTSMQINDIEAGRRIIERLAWRRVGRMTPQAEQAASARAQSEASSQLDVQANAALSDVNGMFREKIRAPLIRRNALPAQWNFWSDENHLQIALAQHNNAQLAIATPPPYFPANYDVAIGAHESMIANLCESMLGGTTIEDTTWLELVKLLSGDSPRALWVHDRAERWSITLADELPLVPRFGDNRIGFTLRLAKVTRGSEAFEHPVEIEASFALQSTRDGPALARDGDLIVRLSEPTQPGSTQSGEAQPSDQEQMRAFLVRKFGAVFPPELVFHGITPPDGGTIGKLNRLQLAEFQAQDGWLTVGYQLKTGE